MSAVEFFDGLVHQGLEVRTQPVFSLYGPPGVRLEEGDGLGHGGAGDDPVGHSSHFRLQPVQFVPPPAVRLLGVDPGPQRLSGGQCVPVAAHRISSRCAGRQIVAEPFAERPICLRGCFGGGHQSRFEGLVVPGVISHQTDEIRFVLAQTGPCRPLFGARQHLAPGGRQAAAGCLGQRGLHALESGRHQFEARGDYLPFLLGVAGHYVENTADPLERAADYAQRAHRLTRFVEGDTRAETFGK